MSTNLSGITIGPADHTVQRGTVFVLNCSRDAKKVASKNKVVKKKW